MRQGQGQKAGHNATQVQVSGDLVMQGVTEERAREIAQIQAREALSTYTDEAHAIAEQRVQRLEDLMIGLLSGQGLLGAAADPAFQVLMRKAQIGAASTEREDDYEMLAELVSHAAKRGDDRPTRAGINRAIEVVDQMDAPALLGLTVHWALINHIPSGGDPDYGLSTLDKFLGSMLEDQALPSGQEWLEHLDVLGAVRIDTVQSFKSFEDFMSQSTPGYLAHGLKKDSEEYLEAERVLAERNALTLMVPHVFKPGFVRLAFNSSESLEKALSAANASAEDEAAILEIAKSQFKIDERDTSLLPAYLEKLRTHESLRKCADWWAAYPRFFSVTPVGTILARSNALRLDSFNLMPRRDPEPPTRRPSVEHMFDKPKGPRSQTTSWAYSKKGGR